MSTAGVIPLRMRTDLSLSAVVNRGVRHWIAKDPLGLNYHILNEEEFMVLQWLREPIALEQLKEKFERQFTPHRVKFRELQDYLVSLHQKSLLIALPGGQGRFLRDIAKQKQRSEAWKSLKQFTHWKFRGIHPQWLLDHCGVLFQWIFSRSMVAAVLLYACFSILTAIVFAADIRNSIPSFSAFFGPDQWVRLVLITSITKVFHEFGHALALRKFGGRCHEIGVMVMFFIPTLYCNTSESWLLKSKWQRAAVGLGGVYVELLLLSMATTVWTFAQSPDLQLWALQVMFVCSISAILLNGNPLIKYDGYFVLSDILEIPNLAQQAGIVIKQFVLRNVWGAKHEVDPWTPSYLKRWLATYAIAAFLFRAVVVVLIGIMLTELLSPFGLGGFAVSICLIAFTTILLAPCISVLKQVLQPGATLHMHHRRGITVTLLSLIAVAFLAVIPFSYELSADYEMGTDEAKTVYCNENGILETILIEEGSPVSQGQVLAVLSSVDLVAEKLSKESQLREVEASIASMVRSRVDRGLERITELRKEQTQLQAGLELLEDRINDLSIRAPQDGIFYRTPSRTKEPQSEYSLSSWSGQPLQKSNLGVFLTKGTRVGIVATKTTPIGKVKIAQRDIALVAQGASVRFMQSSYVHEAVTGTVVDISSGDTKFDELPENLRAQEAKRVVASDANERLESKENLGNVPAPTTSLLDDRYFMVSVAIQGGDTTTFGTSGTAKISVGKRSMAWRVSRWIQNTFRVRL
jgi:putative peptide zinc metalloprotease protein